MKTAPIPIDFIKKKLPTNRRYDEVHAMNLLRIDQHTKDMKTWSEYAKTFSWSRNTVKAFVKRNCIYFDRLIDHLETKDNSTLQDVPDKQLDSKLTTKIPPPETEVRAFLNHLVIDEGKNEFREFDLYRFLNHYNANGWMIGKNKMKNWEATVRNASWCINNGKEEEFK